MQVKALSLPLLRFPNNPHSPRFSQHFSSLHFTSNSPSLGHRSLTSRAQQSRNKSLNSDEAFTLWAQMKDIAMFCGPATGLWISAPFMSLISTALVGRRSSIHLAALGPATVFCDNINLLFMFLSIATSNIVATSLAKGDKKQVQHQISMLLFVAFVCGTLMLFLTQFLASSALTVKILAGERPEENRATNDPIQESLTKKVPKFMEIDLELLQNLYNHIPRDLGMKDSWEPLKALVIASAVNGIGHVILSSFLRYGIEGAAWATMASQVAFYSLLTYFATANGTHIVAAHQVMIQMYSICVVWGEPLSQTAQSFMPELLYGSNRSLKKHVCVWPLRFRNVKQARTLLKSLVIIGALLGLGIGLVGMSVPWLFPNMFTPDLKVIHEMHNVLILFFIALSVSPCTHSLEGTLLAGRDLNFIGLSMSGCFSLGALLLLLVSTRGYGLPGCWCALVGFQWARFFLALRRLLSPNGVLYSDEGQFELEKLKVP
ncbi:hypothetical protein Fmac_000092 [Flemingia macrophylla]|uniref:Protein DETOXIFICATION n=1 Tax=Flemingia macrophylla TaxID=520843 RepID=A0ABD1ND92_9FABA